MGEQKVYRDVINEHRGDYYVTYRPADLRTPFAVVQLTFPREIGEAAKVKKAMESELEYWVRKYPVPAMVTAFDAKEDVVHISDNADESHLIGFIDTHSGHVSRFWKLLEQHELPAEQMEEKYLAEVYKEVPFRRQADVRKMAYQRARASGRAVRLFVFLVVGVPVLIEIVSLGIDWIGYLLSVISVSVGLYKLSRAMGWIKPSKKEQEKAEKELKMSHYYYHCEKNPEGFNRLKVENFERETIESTLREEAMIRNREK